MRSGERYGCIASAGKTSIVTEGGFARNTSRWISMSQQFWHKLGSRNSSQMRFLLYLRIGLFRKSASHPSKRGMKRFLLYPWMSQKRQWGGPRTLNQWAVYFLPPGTSQERAQG
ncbi:uncharacterized protein LOC119161363 [Rhipicephalus microplus]|uniref:uncharacterized protein LOC119161363 n=1 Tax=Rhipicephalus microplus TaxID=6941 RepID=UPI003F6BF0CF